MNSDWQSYETLYKGATDRRLRHVLVVATDAEELTQYCTGTLEVLAACAVRADLVVIVGQAAEMDVDTPPAASLEQLGHTSLELPPEADLRRELVARIRSLRPDVVITADPRPRLRQHPDQRATGRAALDAAWPYAASTSPAAGSGVPHQVNEAWLYATHAPDLFVRVGVAVDEGRVADAGEPHREEPFAQVDLRNRSINPKEPA
jgi:hypothetical protein